MNPKTHQQSSINRSVYQKNRTVNEYLEEMAGLFPGEQRVIDRHRQEISGTPVLDVGVGTGRTTQALLELTEHYTGIDFSEAMVDACKTKFPAAKFLTHDARDMDSFGQDRFGFIWYSFNGLDCVNHEERQAVIKQIFGMLKPGGLFFFSSHNLAIRGEKPWQTKIYQWSWRPAQVIKNLTLIARGILNYSRYRHLQVEGRHYAILTDSGHEFACLHYYVDPQDQLRRLKEIGFTDAQTLSWSGEQFAPEHPKIRNVPHVYFLARKPDGKDSG